MVVLLFYSHLCDMMAFQKLTICWRKFKWIAVSNMALLNKFFCCYSISTGVVVIGSSYVIIDLLRLFYHLTIFYFPGPVCKCNLLVIVKWIFINFSSVRHWYFEKHSGDDVHDLITVTMMKNRIQVILILLVDLLTDIGLLLSVNVSS